MVGNYFLCSYNGHDVFKIQFNSMLSLSKLCMDTNLGKLSVATTLTRSYMWVADV